MDNMKLVDTVMNNGTYTWNNKRGGASQVASKLNRFVVLEELIIQNKDIVARIPPFGGSDHWPMLLEIQGIGTPRNDLSDLKTSGSHTHIFATTSPNGGLKI